MKKHWKIILLASAGVLAIYTIYKLVKTGEDLITSIFTWPFHLFSSAVTTAGANIGAAQADYEADPDSAASGGLFGGGAGAFGGAGGGTGF